MGKYYKYQSKKEKNILTQAIGNSSMVNIIISIGLFFGGILFLAYYLYIGYMPQINNFADFTYMIFAMAIFGMVLFTILAFFFMFPALFYDKFFDEKIKKYLDIWLFVYSISSIPILMLLFLLNAIGYKNIDKWAVMVFFIYLVLFYIKVKVNKWETIGYIALQAMVGYFPIVIYAIFILSGQSNVVTNEEAILTFFLFSVASIVTNIFLIDNKFHKKLGFNIAIVIATLVVLMFFFRTYAVIPSAVMHQLHLGNFVAKKINATEKSCKRLLGLKTSDFNVTMDKSEKTCTINVINKRGKICILSKIGTHMLWQVEEFDRNITIELPIKDFSGMIIDSADNRRCVVYRRGFENNKTK
jgi:hypothetical protein